MRFIKDNVTNNKITTKEFVDVINTLTSFTAEYVDDLIINVDGKNYTLDEYLEHHNAIYETELEVQ